jgi:nucleoside-diphosphate-sugar epimerase
MRVFLTGGTGFIGSSVVRALASRGHEVHALARTAVALQGAHVVRGDLLEPGSYEAQLRELRPEACLHLAWYAVPTDYLTSRENLRWLDATLRLGALAADLGCARFVGTGTCFEYDTAGAAPLTEASPTAPRHLYSACKRAAHDVLSELLRDTKTAFAWARLFFLYGPGEPAGRLVPHVTTQLLAGDVAKVSEGTQRRDFSHVDDVARAIVTIAESGARGVVNVGSGKAVPVRDLVATTARLLGAEDRVVYGARPQRPGDPEHVAADVARLASLGFSPQYDLESGLRHTLASYEARQRGTR